MSNLQRNSSSLDDLAKRHSLCRATIYNEIKRGNLEVTKIGSRSIVTSEQEDAWLERSKRST